MKNILFIVILAGCLSLNSSHQVSFAEKEVQKNRFGAIEVIENYEDKIVKNVMLPLKSFVYDYVQQADFLTEAQQQIQYNIEQGPNMYTCQDRDSGDEKSAAYFLPIFVDDLKEGESYKFTGGRCFQDITFSFDLNYDSSNNSNSVTFHIDAQKPKSLFCRDWFFIANTELYHVEVLFKRGKHEITFNNLDSDALADVQFGGFKIFMFCDGVVDTVISALKALMCFLGGFGVDPDKRFPSPHVPNYMVNANVDFLQLTMNYTLEKRTTQFVDIDESLIQSGDFLAIMRLDGLDPIIMYGTGSHIGHSTMALRFEGELYVVESQDAWYWPVHNIQRNKYRDWIQYAQNCDFHVSHLPLNKEARAKFNETAAQEFFFKTEGDPYGYYNFLYGWIDTVFQNYPPLLPGYLAPIMFSVLEKIIPTTIDQFYTQGLNHRLDVSGYDIAGIAGLAAQKNMSVDDVMAMVEQDGWLYYGVQPRNTTSYVCSAYVAALYKAAGLFDDLEINATEFTPKDVYTISFFDLNFDRPQICVDADPDLPYCQILGKYRMTLPEYSTINPYQHMCEHCPTVAPDYDRPADC